LALKIVTVLNVASSTNDDLIAKLHALNLGLLNDFYQAEGNTKDNENDVAEDILDFIVTLITLFSERNAS
jgi:hypothetical protein